MRLSVNKSIDEQLKELEGKVSQETLPRDFELPVEEDDYEE